MPKSGEDTVKSDVLYPDQLVGRTMMIDPEGRWLNGEVMFWDATDPEDSKTLPDGAKFGWWLPVQDAEVGYTWIACPRKLRESLIDLVPGDAFEILGVTPGQAEHDPYDIEIAVITES